MRLGLAVLLALAGATAGAPTAGAQRFDGRVTLPDGAPAERVLLEATRDDGTVVARALSDDGGRYMVQLPAPGRYGLRVLRIGFLPTLLAARDVALGETATLSVTLSARLVDLQLVVVTTDAVCAADWRADPAVLALWEEARKALQTAQLTAQRSDLAMTVRAYEALASRTGAIHPSTLTAYWAEASTVRPFESVPDSLLVADGYVVPLASGTLYRAPDFDVLLADSFAATHCMRIVAATDSQPGSIGLEFAPNMARLRPDIAGVLWIDRATGALREIDFRFTGIVGGSVANRHGGRVRFLPLRTGHWIVDSWELRMPRAMEPALTVIGGEVGEVRSGEEVIHSSEGLFEDIPPTHESVLAMACGEEAIGATWGMVRGEVIEPDGMPAVGASVSVEWRANLDFTQRTVSSGADGVWFVCRVPRLTNLEVVARRGEGEARAGARLEPEERVAELLLTLARP